MALEITGKIVKVLSEQTGAGKNGPWKKQDFVIETLEQYPKKVCISAWGDKVDSLQQFGEGEELKISFNVESREYNEKWYTDLKVWKFESSSAAPATAAAPKAFKKPNSENAMPDVSTFHSNNNSDDDLPF